MALAQPQLPHGLREEALTAHLQALAGSGDGLAGPLADTILAGLNSMTAIPSWRPWPPAQSPPGTTARSPRRSGCCVTPRATAPGTPPMPAIPSRCSRSPPPLSTSASSMKLTVSSAPPTTRRCTTSQPNRGCTFARPHPPGQRPLGRRRRRRAGGPGQRRDAGSLRVRLDRTLRPGCDRAAPRRHRGRNPAHRAANPSPCRISPACTRAPRPPLPRPRSAKRATARPPPSATSARPVSVSRHIKGYCPATLVLRPGWFALRSPLATSSWPTRSPAPPLPSPTPTRGSRPWPRPRLTAKASPPATRNSSPRPRHSTPTRGQSLRRRRPRRPARQPGQGPGHQAPQDRPQRIPPDRRRPRP